MALASRRKPMHGGVEVQEDKQATLKAVILTADREEGLLKSERKYPKPLTPILGVPILERILKTVRRAGITQTIIVTGYLGHSIRRHLGDGSRLGVGIKYVHNRRYSQGSAVSLKAAQKYLAETEPFLLLRADSFVSAKIIKKALSNLNHKPLLCVDFKPRYSRQIKNATKVLVNKKGYVVDIGKDIQMQNGAYAGILLLDNAIFRVIEQSEKKESPLTVIECLKQLIASGNPLWACDVSNHFWFQVDTLKDLSFVEHLLSGFPKTESEPDSHLALMLAKMEQL